MRVAGPMRGYDPIMERDPYRPSRREDELLIELRASFMFVVTIVVVLLASSLVGLALS